MFYLILQTALLILAAFILGAIVGCLLHRLLVGGGLFGRSSGSVAVSPSAAMAAPARQTSAETPAAAETASVADAPNAKTKVKAAQPKPVRPKPAQPEPVSAPVEEMDDAAAEAAIAALPADASNEDKANAVGVRPAGLDAPMGGTKDNLQRIKGIGKVNEGKLNGLGIYHFSQIKGWSPSEARWVGTFLSFSGRIEREDWIGQADVLSSGGETDFAKRVDKGQVSSSSSKKK